MCDDEAINYYQDLLMGTDIIKYAAIIIDDQKRLLIVKSKKHQIWIPVGGKPEGEENYSQCLKREVREELDVDLIDKPELLIVCPPEPAAGSPDLKVKITAYLVKISGIPKPSQEIESMHWLSRQEFELNKFELGSALAEYIIPELIKSGRFG